MQLNQKPSNATLGQKGLKIPKGYTVCSVCQRVVLKEHVNAEGRCCDCQPQVSQ